MQMRVSGAGSTVVLRLRFSRKWMAMPPSSQLAIFNDLIHDTFGSSLPGGRKLVFIRSIMLPMPSYK